MGKLPKMLGVLRTIGFVFTLTILSLALRTTVKAEDPKPKVADIFKDVWKPIAVAKKVPLKLGQRRCGVAFNGVTLPCAVRPHLPQEVYKKHMDFNTIY